MRRPYDEASRMDLRMSDRNRIRRKRARERWRGGRGVIGLDMLYALKFAGGCLSDGEK